jgi:hypothetical protein
LPGLDAFSQAGLEYFPKALLRDLSGNGKIDAASLQRLGIDDGELEAGRFFQQELQPEYPFVYVGRINSCRAGGCQVSLGAFQTGKPEFFDYYILFNPKGEVARVKIFNYQATHGQEVTVAGWLKQFIGYNGQETLKVGKHIDSISGATISVNALTADVEYRTRMLKHYLTETALQTFVVQ